MMIISSAWPDPVWEFALSNGLRVVFARRPKSRVLELRLVCEGGVASDPHGLSGLAGLAMAMISESALEISDTPLTVIQEELGAIFHGSVTSDAAVIGMSALTANLDDAFSAYGALVSHPKFKSDTLERVRANRVALIARERLAAFDLALRVLPPVLYGRGHIYANPLSGSGTERGVAAITADDLRRYYTRHIVPRSSTLVVVGPYETPQILPLLETGFGRWRASPSLESGPPPAAVDEPGITPAVMIADRPGSSQASLVAGLPTVPRNSARAEALMVADALLGGMFSSRLNLNLRERKGWTYGVRSSLLDARLQGLWLIRSAVRSDVAALAMAEIAGEVQNLAAHCSRDFSRAAGYLVARMPCAYETAAQIADALAETVIYGLPIDYHRDLSGRLRRLNPAEVTEVCRQIVAAGGPKWLIIGDAGKLVDQLRDSTFGQVKVTSDTSAEK